MKCAYKMISKIFTNSSTFSFTFTIGFSLGILKRWDNPVDKFVIEPELLKEMEENLIKIKLNLKVA
jgi:hypothetical protein